MFDTMMWLLVIPVLFMAIKFWVCVAKFVIANQRNIKAAASSRIRTAVAEANRAE